MSNNESVKKCILSIDVGIRNLALCLLSLSSLEKINIHYWKWYDILDDSSENQQIIVKPKKLKKTLQEKKDILENTGICQSIIKKTGKECGKKGQKNTKGRAYCGTHDIKRKHTQDDTQMWAYTMLCKLPEIVAEIDEILENIINGKQVFEIVIEQQSLDNKKILLQSHLIYGFLVFHYKNNIKARFVPAYNKLSVYTGPEFECKLKTPYAKRKFLAKKHTEFFLDSIPELFKWREFYEMGKNKKDDLSDAMLQGLYFIKDGKRNVTKKKPFKKRKVKF